MSISVYTDRTNVHVKNVTEHDIRTHDFEEGKWSKARSVMYVGFENEDHPQSKVSICLDYVSAKALAEGILAKLGEMKYKGKE